MVHKVILLRLHPVSLMQKMIDKFEDFLVEYLVCAISVAVRCLKIMHIYL